MRAAMIACGLLLVSQASSAAVIHVPADYPTIQQALDAATGGDEVLVAPGTYHEHILMGTPQSGVKLHSEAGAASTIIDGSSSNFVLYLSNDGPGTEIVGFTIQNGSVPGFQGGAGIRAIESAPLISDCIIQNNSAYTGAGIYVTVGPAQILRNVIRNNTSVNFGGGVYGTVSVFDGNVISGNQSGQDAGAAISGTNLVISNNHFLSNVAHGAGGGALSVGDNTIVRGNEFRGNSTDRKAGAIDAVGNAVIQGNVFVGNHADDGGGAIYMTGGVRVSQNTFLDNTSSSLGGALLCEYNSAPTIDGNVIVRNSSSAGGGVAISYLVSATLTGNTIVLNGAPRGGGVYVERNAQAILKYNIVSHSSSGGGVVQDDAMSTISFLCNDVWGNTGSDFVGVANPTGDKGNVSGDPLYCNLASLDFHLAGVSPCAPAHSGPCSLIGALGVNCDAPVPARDQTWGSIKAAYR